MNTILETLHSHHSSKKPLIIAHRGSSGIYPENTHLSYQKAAEEGAKWLEIDVQFTRDQIPVIIHDHSLKRVAEVKKTINELTYKEILDLDIGRWKGEAFAGEKIMSLHECLETYTDTFFINVELKTESIYNGEHLFEKKVLEVIKFLNVESKIFISSFSQKALQFIHEVNPDLTLATLYWKPYFSPDQNPIDLINTTGASLFHCSIKQLNREWMKQLNEHHIPVNVYTVNTEKQLDKAISLGVTALFTDFPAKMLNAVKCAV